MELSPKQQVVDLIRRNQNILILSHQSPDGDAIGGALALFLLLKKLNKSTSIAVFHQSSDIFSFLPAFDQIQTDISGTQDFLISVDTQKSEIEKISYKIEDGKLKIIVTPKSGKLKADQFELLPGNFQFDLIIVLDCADIEQIGPIYEKHSKMFFEIPVVNIDHHVSNDYFGKSNLVDVTATSTSEILVSLSEALAEGENLIDEDIATCLLLGLISDTGSFQNSNTTPKSFTVAAQLIAQGARQQEIIQNLYKTRPLATLRIWGRILAGIREDKERKIIWSVVSARDFEQTGAEKTAILEAIDELMINAPKAEIIFLLAEQSDGINTNIRTKKDIDASELASNFGGSGQKNSATFRLKDITLPQAEKNILDFLRDYQDKKLADQKSD